MYLDWQLYLFKVDSKEKKKEFILPLSQYELPRKFVSAWRSTPYKLNFYQVFEEIKKKKCMDLLSYILFLHLPNLPFDSLNPSLTLQAKSPT